MKLWMSLLVCLLLVTQTPCESQAQSLKLDESSFSHETRDDGKLLVIPRLAQAPVIDGDLSDASWTSAAQVKAFWLAGSLDMAEDQTIVLMGFDAENLYVAWACQDRKIVANVVKHDDNQVWKQDAVELFLSPERDNETERQFILASSGSTFDRRSGEGFGPGGKDWNPSWEGKVKQQPWGYTAEMRIPLNELTDLKKFPIRQGMVWSLKLTRDDRGDFTGTRVSSWTPMSGSTAERRAAGRLVFGSQNFLEPIASVDPAVPTNKLARWIADAKHVDVTISALEEKSDPENSEDAPGTTIHVHGKKVAGAMARVTLGGENLPAMPVETTYAFTADIKAISEDETLVAYLVAFEEGNTQQVNFKHNQGWQKVRIVMTAVAGQPMKMPVLQLSPVAGMSKKTEGGGVIHIDHVRLEVINSQELGLDPQSSCLTGNATGAFRTRNRPIAGTYTYTDPMTNDTWFPHAYLPGTGPDQDYGLYRGDIPFSKGLLTDGHNATSVKWPAFWESHQGHDFIFDLKDEYEITRVVVNTNWPGQRMTHLFLKSPGETVYTMVASSYDRVALKTSGVHGEEMPRTDQQVFGKINQRARFVRVQAESRGPGQFSEIEIWGKPVADPGATIKRIPYLQAHGATPVNNPRSMPEPEREIPPIFPMPQEMKLQGTPVALNDGLLIQYEPVNSDRAKLTAEVLRDELKKCFNLQAVVEPASAGRDAVILVGEAGDSPITAAALKRAGQSVTAKAPGPEGYVLAVQDGRILIAGSDARGAFYGTQSLLTLTRTSSSQGLEVPGVMVRDWPSMPIRIIEGRAVPSENLVRALARFRVQYYTPKVINIAKAAEHDAFAQKYFVSFIPFLDFNTTVLDVDPTLTERPATERLEDVPRDSRRNANVGHPRTWEIYFEQLDKWLPYFHGDILYIGMDETYQYSSGSRWNVSPESRALDMSAGPLLAYTLNKINEKAKQYGKRVMMHDTPFCRDFTLSYTGDPDPSWRKAIPLLPKDILFNVWHWSKKWVLEPLGKEHGYDLVYLCTGDRDWRKPDPASMDPNEDYPPYEFPGYFKGMNNYMAESSFTASKLLDTMWVAWNANAVRPKDDAANAAVTHYVSLWNFLHLGEAMPPSFAASKADYVPLDISAATNRSRIDETAYDGQGWVDMGPNMDLRALKSGRNVMAGVPFEIIDESANHGNSVVMAQNTFYTDRTLPSTVEIQTGNLKASSLIFLNCLDNAPGWNYLRRRELAGFYFIVFEDGMYDKFELKYGTSIGTWDGQHYPWEYAPGGDTMTYASVAWTGQTTSGLIAKLFKSQWVNPRPDLAIRKIILRTTFEPSNMNPMLLAVTAVKPGLATDISEAKLPNASILVPSVPTGNAYDLKDGKDESVQRYIAPNGTIIEAQKIRSANSLRTSNALLANDYMSYVGLVNMDGQQSVLTDELFFTFPKPVTFTGVMITGKFREERKAGNFPPTLLILWVDISNDGGKTWKEVGQVKDNVPEETGPVWFELPSKPITHVRLRSDRKDGTPDYFGFNRVQFYQKP